MNDVTYDRTCLGPNCGAEFRTTKSQQTYCSYDCYYAATRDRSRAYYNKVREAGGLLQKVCPDCHNHFETKKLRQKYCSHLCYHHACLEKNRAYAQKIRDEYKAANPKIKRKECELCQREFTYKTKQGKYCDECSSSGLARKIARGTGPVNVPAIYQGLKPGELLGASEPKEISTILKCFICGGEADSADTPCKSCM